MNISGTILHNKVREILPELPSGITPEVLSKISDDPVAQPFFKWFCSNVGRDNYLSPEEVALGKHIKEKGEWLSGEELDRALAEATKDCPEMMNLLKIDSNSCTGLSDELEAERQAYKKDVEYFQTLEENQRSLKELYLNLEDEIEVEESQLEKDHIKINKIYMDCVNALEEFDVYHHQLYQEIELLLDTYANTAGNRNSSIIWSQLPLHNFIKKMELHNDYLEMYVKQNFVIKADQTNDSDYGAFINDEKEQCRDEQIQELLSCQSNIITSKNDEVNARVDEAAEAAILAYANAIYADVQSMIPQNETKMRMDIASLTSSRDFHEARIKLLREKELKIAVWQYAKFIITKILVEDRHASANRRKKRLEKLENIRAFAREKGHGHSDLLCMLMQLQLRRLKEIIGFIADARHYLATEYTLSSIRSESMKDQQSKYEAILKSSPKEQNVFNKLLISLLLGNDTNPDDINDATKRYENLVQANEKRKGTLLNDDYETKVAGLEQFQTEIMSIYDMEVKGPTRSLRPTSYELLRRIDESTRRVRQMQENVTEIRTKVKEMTRKTSNDSFERDTTIMWQRFLANPEELQSKYDEVKKKVENSHFSVTSNK